MNKSRAERRVLSLFYLLAFYVFLQFTWWAYMLISLNAEHYAAQGLSVVQSKVWMIVGEGSVFLLILVAVTYIMQATIRKELARIKQQRNFLLSITHEFKTPLSAIRLGLETLSKRTDLTLTQEEHILHHALGNTSRLSALIDNVMIAARIENGQEQIFSERFNVRERLHQVAYSVASPDVSLKLPFEIIADQSLELKADKLAFDSIVGNLIDNAIKYGAPDDTIIIEAVQFGAILKLRISDRGQGIPVQIRPFIFDRFFRAENEETRSQKGTGLGLYIVKELVALHQGNIQLLDRPGGGSTFEVSLPNQL